MSDLTPALKVTKAQALANRTHIVETAFTWFRERGLDGEQVRARSLVILAQMVGAIVMSRACPDDSPLADDILTSCRNAIMASLPD